MPQLPLDDEADKKSLGQIVSEWEQQYGMDKAGQATPKPPFPAKTGNFLDDIKNALDYSNKYGLNLGPHNDAAIAQAENKASLMQNAEFRPANKKELDAWNIIDKSHKNLMDRFVKEKKIGQMTPTSQDLEEIRSNLLRNDIKESDITPQAIWDDEAYGAPLHGGGRMLLDELFPGIIEKNKQVMKEDISKAGYDPEGLINWHQNIKNDYKDLGQVWSEFNTRMSKKPDTVYHMTPERNLETIAKEGLVPNKNRTEPRWKGYEMQGGKVFFAPENMKLRDRPTMQSRENPSINSGWFERFYEDEIPSHLRTKFREDMFPDAAAPRKAFQTQKSTPPEALEIEAAPGQWEPLLDYIKKRGGK